MDELVKTLEDRFPDLNFRTGKLFSWSPETREVFYIKKSSPKASWSLLHETGHALLKHASYYADFELVRLETAAWDKACQLAEQLGIEIDDDHIQDCLDTYRDWLHQRSNCPSCETTSIQQPDRAHYRCFNCRTVWRVTPSRFCRVYRHTEDTKKPPVLFYEAGGFKLAIVEELLS